MMTRPTTTRTTAPKPMRHRRIAARGFTMIELIVVMAVLGLLLSLAVPRYLDALDRGKVQVMAHDLAQIREAIDRYYGDRGAYPERLEDLVTARYLRAIPPNPYTDEADWVVVPPPGEFKGSVYDVRDPGTGSRGPVDTGAGEGASGPEGAAARQAPQASAP